ncbi:PR-1-like protein [Coniochaeta ligniaria NRRL 30616]|uniref:PR-1-like protein n=1 Tax=Coniochaeta ligniaria NRRL 30616 TaxID=1408157 RepID=A0A1J7JN57_9PEZI|nr:PR-1-like protein [Coniochaeta ligniaria NRRL 30616]
MKTSLFLAASGAILAMATPLNVEKRKIETEVVIEWKTVYVTEGALPSVFAADPHHHAPALTVTSPTAAATPEAETVAPVAEPSTEASVAATSVAPEQTVEPTTETTEAAPTPTVAETPDPSPVEDPPASSTQQAEAAQPTDYASTAVYQHNLHRLNFSAPAVEWSDTYASYAAQTAATCVFAHDLTPGGGGYGQNLALYGSSNDVRLQGETLTVAQAITDMWVNGEVNAYPTQDLGQPNVDMSNFEAWGHFSQVVWVASEQIGCATQYCPAGTIYPNLDAYYTVCDYYPPGNMGGGYGANVLASLNEPTVVV